MSILFLLELHQSLHKWGRGLLSQQIQKFTRCFRRTRSLMSRLDSRLHSGCFRRFSRRVQIWVFWASENLSSWISNVTGLCWNKFACAFLLCFCRRLRQAVRFPKCESSLDKSWIICGEHAEAARVWQMWIWDCVSSFYRWHLSVFCMAEVVQSLLWLRFSPALVKTAVNLTACGPQLWLFISSGSLHALSPPCGCV